MLDEVLPAEGARRLVGVVGAYRYHLPDAAQYTVGLLLAAMLDEPVMAGHDVHAVADQLLHLLAAPRSSAQCQGRCLRLQAEVMAASDESRSCHFCWG